MVQNCDIRTGIYMILKQSIIVCSVYHVVRCDDYIWMMHSLNAFQVLHKHGDVRVIDTVLSTILGKQDLQIAAF